MAALPQQDTYVSPFSSPLTPKKVEMVYDDSTDPFSDNSSVSNYSMSSPISSTTDERRHAQVESTDPLVPLKSAYVHCCRCPNTQSFIQDSEDDHPSWLQAACDSCTHAFCRKCTIDSDSIITFDSKFKADISTNATNVSYYWSCSSCGVLDQIPDEKIRRTGAKATIDIKKLQCRPCNQKANASSLCLAIIRQGTINFTELASKQPQIVTLATVGEGNDSTFDPSATDSPRPKMFKRSSTANLRRYWSLSSMKRWTSVSSHNTI